MPTHAEEDDESSFFRKSKGERGSYWNLIFYNAGTKKHHLLDSTRKMIISSYSTEYINSKFTYPNGELEQMIKTGKLPEFAEKQNGGVIIYDVTTDDLNKNGKLDDQDPSYLFVSDKNGYNFRQISPTRLNVTGWKMIEKFGIVLIETGKRNKTTQYIYDLKKNAPATEVFDKGFIEKIDGLYKKQRPVKQEK